MKKKNASFFKDYIRYFAATIIVINYWNNAKLREVFVIFIFEKMS